jgi:hypothetical protein
MRRLMVAARCAPPELEPAAWDRAFRRTSEWIGAAGLGVGELGRSEAIRLLDRCNRQWLCELTELAAPYDEHAILRRVLEANEITGRRDWLSVLTSHRATGGDGPSAATARSSLGRNAERSLALRALVELFSATPPGGTNGHVPDSVFQSLWAAAVQYLILGTHMDEIAAGIVPARVMRHERGWLEFGVDTALQEASEAHVHASLRDDAWPEFSGGRERELWEAVDAAFAKEHGYGLMDLLGLLAGLADATERLEDPWVATTNMAGLVRAVMEQLGCSEQTSRRALDSLSLSRVEDYGTTDHVPWRFRRTRSLLRCPLVRVGRAGETVLWSWLPAQAAMADWASRVRGQHGQARTPELDRALSKFNNWKNRHFEEVVEIVFRSDLRLRARTLRRVPGDPQAALGDIDVLVVAPAVKVIALIETKANAPALTPQQLRRELARLRPRDGSRDLTDIDRVVMREEHVRGHVADALAALGVDGGDDLSHWRVCSALVYERDMWGPRFESPPVPVFSIDQIREQSDLEAWLGQLPRR